MMFGSNFGAYFASRLHGKSVVPDRARIGALRHEDSALISSRI
jgi:hypothetical protein